MNENDQESKDLHRFWRRERNDITLNREWNNFCRCLFWPVYWMSEWIAVKPGVVDEYGSISFVSMKLSKDEFEPFIALTRQALDLIEAKDSPAWNMVNREITYIIDDYIMGRGQFRRRYRACVVDIEKNDKRFGSQEASRVTGEWDIAALASVIVHEATHGRLFSLGIPYNEETRARCERICINRQRRFLRHLPGDASYLMDIRPPFDAAQWEPYWNSAVGKDMRREHRRRLAAELKSLFTGKSKRRR